MSFISFSSDFIKKILKRNYINVVFQKCISESHSVTSTETYDEYVLKETREIPFSNLSYWSVAATAKSRN